MHGDQINLGVEDLPVIRTKCAEKEKEESKREIEREQRKLAELKKLGKKEKKNQRQRHNKGTTAVKYR